jgi:hypothetical protein
LRGIILSSAADPPSPLALKSRAIRERTEDAVRRGTAAVRRAADLLAQLNAL